MNKEESTFFNTTGEVNPLLKEYKEKNLVEADIVCQIFLTHAKEAFTPCDVWKILGEMDSFGHYMILTNVRRAITVLTKRGILRKLPIKKIGIYGRPCYCWIFNDQQTDSNA